jgi:hypothetical protein
MPPVICVPDGKELGSFRAQLRSYQFGPNLLFHY